MSKQRHRSRCYGRKAKAKCCTREAARRGGRTERRRDARRIKEARKRAEEAGYSEVHKKSRAWRKRETVEEGGEKRKALVTPGGKEREERREEGWRERGQERGGGKEGYKGREKTEGRGGREGQKECHLRKQNLGKRMRQGGM